MSVELRTDAIRAERGRPKVSYMKLWDSTLRCQDLIERQSVVEVSGWTAAGSTRLPGFST